MLIIKYLSNQTTGIVPNVQILSKNSKFYTNGKDFVNKRGFFVNLQITTVVNIKIHKSLQYNLWFCFVYKVTFVNKIGLEKSCYFCQKIFGGLEKVIYICILKNSNL